MIRLTWLQARTQTLAAAAALAALAVIAAVTGVHLSHLYSQLVASCHPQNNCSLALSDFLGHYRFLQNTLDVLLRLTPALLGVFWGAPMLARELETGSFRLGWTQSVSRRRWLLTKLGLLGGATAVLVGLLTLTATWWYRAIDATQDSRYAVFDRRDLAPIGYALFAFAAGTLAGAILRRTVPAMAATIAVFVAARVAVATWVRPRLLPPLHVATSLLNTNQFGFESRDGSAPALVAPGSAPHGGWTISSHLVTSSGHVAGLAERTAFVKQYCGQIAPPPLPGAGGARGVRTRGDGAAFDACREHAAQIYHLVVAYQPAGRYWAFQWMELGIFVALAAAALVGCYLWTTRRLT
jgi:hypothetical protein